MTLSDVFEADAPAPPLSIEEGAPEGAGMTTAGVR